MMPLAAPAEGRICSTFVMPESEPDLQPFLSAQNISKKFAAQMVLNDVSLQINPGELVAILGPSGCGKTTLLRIIAGLERQDSGRILIDQRDLSAAPASARGCGIVFQSYALFPNLTVAANIAFGMNRRTFTRKQRSARVHELLELIGLPDIAGRYPSKLSGGQQQRVALARALAVNPSLLLLDEPLSALDSKVRVRLRGEIRRIQQRLGLTTILVTHDQEEALTMADRVVVMDHGHILQIGTPWEIYNQPNRTVVADFVGSMNLLADWTIEGNHLLSREGHTLDCSALMNGAGTRVCVLFRPEEAELILPFEKEHSNCIPATVDRVEFRGAVTRVHLTALGTPVMVDAPSHQAAPFLDGGNAQVCLRIPAEAVRVFRKDGSAL